MATVTNATQLLAIEIANKFPDVTSGVFVGYIAAGDCACIAWSADASAATDLSLIEGNMDSSTGKWSKLTYTWDNTTAGVDSNGRIVGTSPKVNLG